MRWFTRAGFACLLAATLGAILGVVCQPSRVHPADKDAPAAKQYSKGRVAPKNLDHLRKVSYEKHSHNLKRMKRLISPPASWDSVAKGYVGPIKDQGQCGSCWDFSGTGVVEIANNLAGVGGGPTKMVLSEQYTLSCGRNGGCNGDDNTTVLQWAKDAGLPLTADYGPYNASPGRCSWTSSMPLYKIADWGFADSNGGSGVTPTADIKAAIMQYGCVGCAVDASFDDPGAGVISGGGSNIDHDVILVGWDDSKGKGGAWKMRNSWGTGWGNGGYAWIEYGAYSIGTEAVWAVVAAPSPAPPAPLPPYMKPTEKTLLPGNGWSGQLTFEGGILTNVAPAVKP